MRTRNNDTPKSATAKKTPPAKKSAAKTTQKSTDSGPSESATPKSAETKRASVTKAKQAKSSETSPTPNASIDSKPKPEPAVEEAKAPADAAKVTPKVVSGSKPSVKRTPGKSKTPATAKSVPAQTPKSGENVVVKVEESPKKEEVVGAKVVESMKEEEPVIENVGQSVKEGKMKIKEEEPSIADGVESKKLEEADDAKVDKSSENEESNVGNEIGKGEEEMKGNKDTKSVEVEEEPKNELAGMEEGPEEDMVGGDAKPGGDEYQGDEVMEEFDDQEDHEEPEEEELDVGEPAEETETLEDEEQRELTAIAKERKIKKEHEIFVGGLDRDAVEEDVKKVFEKIGEIVEVRLHKNPLTNKNKGYAFVKFANKEHASRALSEMKNPLINGKRCGTAPSEDNDTLFLGNICNTWTKEAIKQKLKEYGVEGVENITLVPDAQHEGLSRGFAFLEFSCHPEAMLAYKRLQKPDVVFGHSERTAKVAFAEPLREPDPEIMAQVKSVFVDGLPPHWDEDRVKEQFKVYGEIERIMLARNMSTAKRKDFGFVDFTTHEAAVACIDGINNKELGDGNSKTKVKARLSNPLPKTQAVKGGMCGGFRIGHGGGGSFSKFGRGFGRGGQPFHRANFQRGRGFYQRGRGQSGRMGFGNEYELDNPYPEFHGRRFFGRGGRRGSFRGAYQASGGGPAVAAPSRSNLERPRHGAADRGRGKYISSSRQPFSPEGRFDRPFMGRHFDDPYLYDEGAHGIKRPFYMTEQDPGYMEPSRFRPRFDYPDPPVSFRGTHYQDAFGAGSDLYSHDYYGSDYGGGAYSSFYGGDRSYGGGYYY
ncbi:hypothetical protein L1049_024321 [Liquidambar formosana]|uniref:RRM domain-containing protein n=1 Tax=Liquidambar formosana TaxID=63359 RepID=A0AAP0S0H7_LIQFO